MKTLTHPRNTTAENDGYTGPDSQIVVDSERYELRLHDGVTPGGHRILNLAQLVLLFMSIDSEFGEVEFAAGDKGFLVRTGDREYALRELIAGTGITITNPLGTGDNPTISLGDISGNIIGGIAGRIAYAVTTGTAAALAADFPEGWPNTNGAVGILKFHVAPADGAILTIDGNPGIPLLTADGSNDINRVAGINDIGMIVKVDGNYHLIGLITPSSMGILPIAGLVATNVQDALAELAAAIGSIGGGAIQTARFGFASTTVTDGPGPVNVPIADDQYVWISARSLGTLAVDCSYSVNGTVTLDPGPDNGFLHTALYYRKNDKLYSGNITSTTGESILSSPFTANPTTAVVAPTLIFHSNIVPAATEIAVEITGFASIPRIHHSVPGVPFVF